MIRFDLIDYEMVMCVSRLFMPSPYMTSTWVFITLIFVVLALMGLCFIKFFVKDTMFENRKKECEEWRSYLEDVKKKEIERLEKLKLEKRDKMLSRAGTKQSRMNSRKNSNASLLGDYAVAPDDQSSDPEETKRGKKTSTVPKKSRFGIAQEKEKKSADKSPS